MNVANPNDLLAHRFSGAQVGATVYLQLVWVATAGIQGFAVAALFAGALHLPRAVYLVLYVLAVGLFLAAYLQLSGLTCARAGGAAGSRASGRDRGITSQGRTGTIANPVAGEDS